jgi:small subunit ribosomal protein S17
MAEKTQEKTEKNKNESLVETNVPTRGRTFQGKIIKKFPTRIVIEFEKTIYVPKYESYKKRKTKLHARIPESLDVQLGDIVKIKETRPLSKIIHFVIIEIVQKAPEKKEAKEKEK